MKRGTLQTLLGALGDGAYHSGEAIAQTLGCSRTAVWKHIEVMRRQGIEIKAAAGRGYQLVEPIELLDRDRIHAALEPAAAEALHALQVHESLDSTNDHLLSLAPVRRHGLAVFAECQTAGRGRRGRRWVSPFGRNIYLSLGWTFDRGAAELGCLPLLVALATCMALDRVGLEGHGVKWPNDLLLDGRKLGGCLVEIQGDASGPCHAVLGVGINVNMQAALAETRQIDQPWASLAQALPAVSRNAVAAALLNALLEHVLGFQAAGFQPFMRAWTKRDALAGAAVTLQHPAGSVTGRADGITENGALRLQSPAGSTEYNSGEVSLRHRDS